MGTPLIGTVIITGGNGSLGSEIAISIAKSQPFAHLLLAVRDTRSESVRKITERIRLIGPRSLEVLKLDLTSFASVIDFTQNTVKRVQNRDIPPVIVLINSAAVSSYVADRVTLDGYDPVYQTNCVGPFLLTVSLLEAFRAGDGTANGGARIINLGCSTMSCGRLDYFDGNDGDGDENENKSSRPSPGTPLTAKEGNVRFGSSKLLLSAAMYALRRSLILVSLLSFFLYFLLFENQSPNIQLRLQMGNMTVNIYTLDPGRMTGESHLTATAPLSVRMAHQTRSGLRPFLRMFSKSAINKTSVPAEVIAEVAFQHETATTWGRERYYILDNEYEAGSVIPVLRDAQTMDTLLVKMIRTVEGGVKESGSRGSSISRWSFG